jgi:peptidoglycan/LPS O-acetylase OafA/YrhL
MNAAPHEPLRARDDLLPLTAARGIAAWWVVLFHLRFALIPWVPPWAIRALGAGNLAVDFFFLLSGFVIYLNYGERVGGGRAIRDFLFRRFARVYPLHLLMLLGFAAYFGTAALFGPDRLEDNHLGYFAASLLLVQNWGFTDHLHWNVPAWSISTEAFAYLLFPALVLLLAPARRSTALLAGIVVALALSVPAFFFAFGYAYPDAVPQTGLFRCSVQFATGMMLCELYRRLRRRERLAFAFLAAAAVLALASAVLSVPLVPLVWAALILALALSVRGNPLSWPPLVWLGEISYATYLCHYLALVLWKYAFVEAGQSVAPALIALYLAAVLLLSALLFHGFERPAQRRLLGWWKRRRLGGAAIAAAPAALSHAGERDDEDLVARPKPARAPADPGDGPAGPAGARLAAAGAPAGRRALPGA